MVIKKCKLFGVSSHVFLNCYTDSTKCFKKIHTYVNELTVYLNGLVCDACYSLYCILM